MVRPDPRSSTAVSGTATATTAATVIVPAKTSRRAVTVQNTGTVACTIALGAAPGLALNPGDTMIEEHYIGNIIAWTASGSTTLLWIEVG